MSHKDNTEGPSLRPGWTRVPGEKIPAPTFWPAALALGSVLMLWGLVTSYIVACVGLLLLALSVGGWLEEMRND